MRRAAELFEAKCIVVHLLREALQPRLRNNESAAPDLGRQKMTQAAKAILEVALKSIFQLHDPLDEFFLRLDDNLGGCAGRRRAQVGDEIANREIHFVAQPPK